MQDTQMSQPSAGDISLRYNQISDTKKDLKERFGSKMQLESEKRSKNSGS